MKNDLHNFHIPVMGTGYSVDSPIRVAPFGISSVISIVDHFLLEKIREYYCKKFRLPFEKIPSSHPDARAERITAWLETVREIVEIKMEAVKGLPFFQDNDKKKYFEMLPDDSPLKREYESLLQMEDGPERERAGESLTRKMRPGSIDVNIMVKVDKTNYDQDGNPLKDEFSDAKAALRGFAESSLDSSVVLSAGINKGLFTYMSRFKDFYRDGAGKVKKRIILKVSDFRSALIQGRFLARKGLEVYEYRIESGLNCGGHAFATNGYLMPAIIKEFKENRDRLTTDFRETVKKFYLKKGWAWPESAYSHRPLVTAQGGIGVFGEAMRLQNEFGMDATGWASPFMLVPEATLVDKSTRRLLEKAGEKDLFLSRVSPFGVPFNNVRNSESEKWTRSRAAKGKPGSPCPKKLLAFNTEYSEKPLCVASGKYQEKKLAEIEAMDISKGEKAKRAKEVTEKACLCEHLGNSALIDLGIVREENSPQIVCPGPNIGWFTREYTLAEMVNHIYGRGKSLVPANRPHMFAKEMKMYVDYFEDEVKNSTQTEREIKALKDYKDNLMEGMALCRKIAREKPYPGENLESLKTCVEKEEKRLKSIYIGFKRRLKLKEVLDEGLASSLELSPGYS